MDEPTDPRDAALIQAIETVRALLVAFPETMEQSQSLDEIDTANLAQLIESLTALRTADNAVYMVVVVAGTILRWASRESGRSAEEILNLISSELNT